MHKIFLLHGMGQFSDGWSGELQKLIEEKYNELTISKNFEFHKNYQFVEITYSKVFNEYVDALAKKGDEYNRVVSGLGASGLKFFNVFFEKLEKERDSFYVTHLGDVFLDAFTDFKNVVAANVGRQMLEALKEKDHESWSIIAHSLGTKVIFDTLQEMYTGSSSHDNYQKIGVPVVLVTVANVGYLIQKITGFGNVYNGQVYPSEESERGTCNRYLNVFHELDPFLFVWPFSPAPVCNPEFLGDKYFTVNLSAKDMVVKSTHDIINYFSSPDVVIKFFELITGMGVIDVADKVKMIDAYRQKTLSAQFNQVRGRLQLAKMNSMKDWQELADMWDGLKDILKG